MSDLTFDWFGFLFQPTPSARRVTIEDVSYCTMDIQFQPTPSARRVTKYGLYKLDKIQISTHTLRKEGDDGFLGFRIPDLHFNPHPPQGG